VILFTGSPKRREEHRRLKTVNYLQKRADRGRIMVIWSPGHLVTESIGHRPPVTNFVWQCYAYSQYMVQNHADQKCENLVRCSYSQIKSVIR